MIEFTVYGDPRPQGSKSPGVSPSGKPFLRESSGENLKTWRNRVAVAVLGVRPKDGPLEGPVSLHVTFRFRPPKKARFPFPIGRRYGDLGKLIRAIEDELSGIIIVDDTQIVVYTNPAKVFADPPGAVVRVTPIEV